MQKYARQMLKKRATGAVARAPPSPDKVPGSTSRMELVNFHTTTLVWMFYIRY